MPPQYFPRFDPRSRRSVVLLLEGAGREPGPDDVTEILNAAQPLLRALADRALSASLE